MNSRDHHASVRRRAAALVVGTVVLTTGCGALALRALPGVLAPGPGRTTADRVLDIAGLFLVAGTAWLAVLVLLAALPLLRGAPGAPDPSRRRVRAAVVLVCSAGVALPGPATAAEGPAPAQVDRVPTAVLLDGLRLPDRLAGPVVSPSRQHHVRAGDTLWDLARSTLPPQADDAAVDRRWRAIHAANRSAVGDDPHLLRIGTRLTLPARHHLGKARP